MAAPPEPPAGCRVVTAGPTTAWVREGYDALLADETLRGPGGFSVVRARHGLADGRAGRGTAVVLDVPGHPGERALWRHYRRGGVLGPLLRDAFRDPWRPMREYALVERLRAAGVPTPRGLAALAHHAGARGWTGDLLTALEPGVEDLAAFLRRTAALASRERAACRRRAAGAVAAAIGRLHDAGCRHRDLNLGNLLVSPDGRTAFVVDLDGSTGPGGPLGDADRAANLLRLDRSAAKSGWRGWPVTPREKLRLVRAYVRARAGVRALLLLRAGRAGVAMHRLGWRIGRMLGG